VDTCCSVGTKFNADANSTSDPTASSAPMVGAEVLRHTPDRSAGPLVHWMIELTGGAVPPEDDPPDDPPDDPLNALNDALSGSGGRHPSSSSEQRLTKAMLLV
jgi:hypothetical protein